MPDEVKLMTKEEIHAVCPNYKGAPEKFDPNFKTKKGKKPKQQQSQHGPTTSEIPPPTRDISKMKPTPQRNVPILRDSIYGEEEITPRATFTTAFPGIIKISNDLIDHLRVDEVYTDKIIVAEEINYYAIALLWFRMITIKQSQRIEATTDEERQILQYINDMTFNVPEPLYDYLRQVGT